MNAQKLNNVRRKRRKTGIRKGVFGSPAKPRLSVYRSSKHIYAQLIEPESGKTLGTVSSRSKSVCPGGHGGNIEAAKAAGIEAIAFDRNGFKYHGRVKALADAAREAGLKF